MRLATPVARRCSEIACRPRRQSLRTLRHDRLSERSSSSRCQISRIRIEPRQSLASKAQRRTRNDFSLRTSKIPAGGARRDRTDDLLLAKQALSQLSYGPGSATVSIAQLARSDTPDATKMVGLGRLELPTSRLSSARSNQLSYKPGCRGPADRPPPAPAARRVTACATAMRDNNGTGLVREERETKTAVSRQWARSPGS